MIPYGSAMGRVVRSGRSWTDDDVLDAPPGTVWEPTSAHDADGSPTRGIDAGLTPLYNERNRGAQCVRRGIRSGRPRTAAGGNPVAYLSGNDSGREHPA